MSTPHDGTNKIILERIALTNSRDTIPIRPTTNQVLRPQNTKGYVKMAEMDLPLWRDFSDILLEE
ncbi:MAG: hypothetical protein ABSF21_07180 [Dehalococcoidia bacterium]